MMTYLKSRQHQKLDFCNAELQASGMVNRYLSGALNSPLGCLPPWAVFHRDGY